MDEAEFNKGVEIARHVMADLRDDLLRTWTDEEPPEIRHDHEEFRPKALIQKSKTDTFEWEILKELTLGCLDKGIRPPDDLIEWVRDVMDGKLQRPTRKQPDLKINFRNTEAVHAIQALVNMGWQASRSKSLTPKCCAKGGSAVDAVGYVLNLSFSTTDNIWAKRQTILSPPKPTK